MFKFFDIWLVLIHGLRLIRLGSLGSQNNSISNISETTTGGSAKSSGRCWSIKKSNIEATVASDSQSVVITGVSSIAYGKPFAFFRTSA